MSKDLAVAVHIISASSDHYNILIHVDINDKDDIAEQLKSNIMEEPAYWSDYYVTTNVSEYDRIIKDIIRELIDESDEDEMIIYGQ